jgi:hypothetical protein
MQAPRSRFPSKVASVGSCRQSQQLMPDPPHPLALLRPRGRLFQSTERTSAVKCHLVPTPAKKAQPHTLIMTIVFGSNTNTLKQTTTTMKAAEAYRTELISRMDLRVVREGKAES